MKSFPAVHAVTGSILFTLAMTACQNFRPVPQELSAGRQLAARRAEGDFLSFDSGRRLAEARRNADPIGPLVYLVSAITPGSKLALHSDLIGAKPEFLVGPSTKTFFFFEPFPGGQRLTEIERAGKGWHSRTSPTGDATQLPGLSFSSGEVALNNLGLNYKVESQGGEPRVEAHDRVTLDVLTQPDPNNVGSKVLASSTFDFGSGGQALLVPGDRSKPPAVTTFRPGRPGLPLSAAVDELQTKNKELGIVSVFRAHWTSGPRFVSVRPAEDAKAHDVPYTFGMTLGDIVQREGDLPFRGDSKLRLVILRGQDSRTPALLAVRADGSCWLGGSAAEEIKLFANDALTILPELYDRRQGALAGGALHKRLVSQGLARESAADRATANVIYLSQGARNARPISYTEGMTLSDSLRIALGVMTPAEKEMFRPVWLVPAGDKTAILFAASINHGCFFGHGMRTTEVPLLPGDRIQIIPGKYDPDKDHSSTKR